MSVNLQNKILDSSIPPPPDVWNKIADQLDEEFRSSDIMLSQKLHDYEISPPPFIFENVLTGLHAGQEPEQPTKGAIFSVRRISVAAATIGLIALGLVYFSNDRSITSKNAVITTMDVVPGSSPALPNNDRKVISPESQTNPGVSFASALPVKKFNSNSRRARIERRSRHARLNRLLAANAITAISVTAPPIYDGNGNIIMDESLVSAPDDNYIIVTSPNGEQTKINRKFLKMLSVLNGGSNTNYMNPENFQWKMRFEEWRSKLLQQASYIPTANNFLDIMDLKEMLQEN